MNEAKLTELMNLVLDGVATPSQRSALETHLSQHPEARSEYDALARVSRRLDAEPMTEPPAELEPRILDTIHGMPRPHASHAPSDGGISTWFKGFLAAPKLRPWSTFGLGLAAGAFLFAAVQYGRPGAWDLARDIDPSQVSGSMIEPAGREPVGSVTVNIPSGAITGSAVVYQAGSEIGVDVTLQSTVAIEWVVEFDGEAWALQRVEKKGDATRAFASNAGSVRGLHTGEGGVKLVFSGPADAAKSCVLKVFQDGQPVFEGTPALSR